MKQTIRYKSIFMAPLLLFSTIYSSNIIDDLDLKTVFKAINRTKTYYGTKSLKTILYNPINDIEQLHNRQQIITHIFNQPELQKELTSLLKKFNQCEKSFTKIIIKPNSVGQTALSEFYFSNSYFKEWSYSPLGLEIGQIAYFGNLCSSIIVHGLLYAIAVAKTGTEHTCAIHPGKKHTHHTHNHGNLHHTDCDHHHKKPQKSFLQQPGLINALGVWHSVAQFQEIYAVQSIVRKNLACINKMYVDLIHYARGIQTITDMYQLIKDHPEITINLTNYKQLHSLSNGTIHSKKLNDLLNLLKKPTFTTNGPSLFSRIGNILAAYRLAQEVTHELSPILDTIGELDAYLSCAQLVSEHEKQSLQYSFAHYITKTDSPIIDAQNFWHPIMAYSTNAQLNSIALGTDENPVRTIILTGPNASGKSTNLKAISLCTYCAQTITIVPAQKYSQSIFKEIYSSIIVSDNIEKNLSLFATELTNAELLLERVDALKNNEYMFISFDELFTSTHHAKGEMVAMALLIELLKSPQVITIASTHFEKLINLANDYTPFCANYTLENFILRPGVSSSSESFDIINKKINSRLLH